MLLRKRNLNVQSHGDTGKEVLLGVKRKNSNTKNVDASMGVRKADADVEMQVDDLAPEYDFDKETLNDAYAYALYAHDVFVYYVFRERFFVVGDYFGRQRNIGIKERMTVVDWLVEVQETFELNHETLYLSVKLMDRYLDRVSDVKLDKLQLVASAAAFIASKFDERSPPLIDDFIYLSNDSYDREELIVMERDLLKTVDFDLGAPLSYRFLRRYARVLKIDMPTLTLARYVLETSLMFLSFCRVSESLMAAAACLLALRMKNVGGWSPILQKYCGYRREEVEPLANSLNHMLIKTKAKYGSMVETIYKKYSHEIFFEVAKVSPLPDELPPTASIDPPLSLLHRQ